MTGNAALALVLVFTSGLLFGVVIGFIWAATTAVRGRHHAASVDALTSAELYAIAVSEPARIIGNARPVDADNGCVASYSLSLGTSDILGILLALRRHGYAVRRTWL